MQLEWARLLGQRTLIVAPLSVARQTVREAMKIGQIIHYTRSGDDLIDGTTSRTMRCWSTSTRLRLVPLCWMNVSHQIHR